MAITNRIDLSGKICEEDGCSKLVFNDTTGLFVDPCIDEQNDLGYGLSGGILINDVNSSQLNIYYPNMTIPIVFNFTIVNGLITAATITNINLVVTNITTLLSSTVFPFVDFDITLDYGVIMPSLEDGIVKWDYTIDGLNGIAPGITSFSYTTSGGFLLDCKANCCIENKYVNLDTNCDCSKESKQTIIMAEILLSAARYASEIGLDSKSTNFITKANELCKSNCKDC